MFTRVLLALFVSAALFAAPFGQGAAAKNATTKAGSTAKTGAAEKSSSKLIDINSASQEELDALPGIGKAYSKKIIDNRPYQSKNQLVSKGVLPKSVYDGIKDRIVARQQKK
jgi:DNA uptake protein ComE-like DNA-binding protein